MVYTVFLGKQGKRVYTIGPERRVYTVEASDLEKEKKEGFHGGGGTFFYLAAVVEHCGGRFEITILKGNPGSKSLQIEKTLKRGRKPYHLKRFLGQGFRPPTKFTPKIIGIPLQSHFLEPQKSFSPTFCLLAQG